MEEVEQWLQLLSFNNFDRLNALCQARPRIFSMGVSPSIDELRAFHELFREEPYVKGLYDGLKLRGGIDQLEKGFAKICFQANCAPRLNDERGVLGPNKKLEREVRFVHRTAKIVGAIGSEHEKYFASARRELCDEAEKHLRRGRVANAFLEKLADDEFFQEGLIRPGDICVIRALPGQIDTAIKAIETIKTITLLYPCKRDKPDSFPLRHQTINRLSDACFRMFGNCDPSVIRRLIRYKPEWDTIGPKEIRKLIKEARDRKVDLFGRRQPQEDNVSAALDGEWHPAETLNPPWMSGYDTPDHG